MEFFFELLSKNVKLLYEMPATPVMCLRFICHPSLMWKVDNVVVHRSRTFSTVASYDLKEGCYLLVKRILEELPAKRPIFIHRAELIVENDRYYFGLSIYYEHKGSYNDCLWDNNFDGAIRAYIRGEDTLRIFDIKFFQPPQYFIEWWTKEMVPGEARL